MTTANKDMENTKDADAVGIESTALLDDWNVGADGMPVKKGDMIVEEDGELKTIHADGSETRFV